MKAVTGKVTHRKALQLFEYNAETGVITRKILCGGQMPGAVVGTSRKDGYLACRVDRKEMLLHRLAWLLFYGQEPDCEIDHINSNRSDNRVENLRLADRTVNNQNRRKAHKNNALGILGVGVTASGKFKARIRVNKKLIDLGIFHTHELASAAYLSARRTLHKGNTL